MSASLLIRGAHEAVARHRATRYVLLAAGIAACLVCALVCKSYRCTFLDIPLYDLHLSADGRSLAVSTIDGMTLCDLETGEQTGPLPYWFLQFSPDGTLVAALGRDPARTVRIWNRTTGQTVYELEEPITSLAFSPDGRWLATSQIEDLGPYRVANRTLVIRDAATGEPVQTIHAEEFFERPPVFSPDGSLLAAAGYSPVYVYRVSDGQLMAEIKEYAVDRIQFESGDQLALLVSNTQKTSRHTFDDAGRLQASDRLGALIIGYLDSDGTLATDPETVLELTREVPGLELSLEELDEARTEVQQRQQLAWAVEDPLLSPDGTHVVGVAGDDLQVIDLQTGLPVVTQPAPPYINHLGTHWDAAFSPDGRTLRLATIFGTVTTWDLQSGRQRDRLTGLGPSYWPASWTWLIVGAGLWLAAWLALARPRKSPGEIAAWHKERCDWMLVGANVLIVVGLMVVIKVSGSVSEGHTRTPLLTSQFWMPSCAAAGAAPLFMLVTAIASRARAAAVFAVVAGIPFAIGALWLSGGFLMRAIFPPGTS